MTLQDAVTARIPRVCRVEWAGRNCYVRIPLQADPDNPVGEFAELYDPDLFVRSPYCQLFRMVGAFPPESDTFEVYTGTVSEFESGIYSES